MVWVVGAVLTCRLAPFWLTVTISGYVQRHKDRSSIITARKANDRAIVPPPSLMRRIPGIYTDYALADGSYDGGSSKQNAIIMYFRNPLASASAALCVGQPPQG